MSNEEILLEMLDIAIKFMNEQEACYYCSLSGTPDCHAGRSDDVCYTGLYMGLERMAKKRIKDNEIIRNDAA